MYTPNASLNPGKGQGACSILAAKAPKEHPQSTLLIFCVSFIMPFTTLLCIVIVRDRFKFCTPVLRYTRGWGRYNYILNNRSKVDQRKAVWYAPFTFTVHSNIGVRVPRWENYTMSARRIKTYVHCSKSETVLAQKKSRWLTWLAYSGRTIGTSFHHIANVEIHGIFAWDRGHKEIAPTILELKAACSILERKCERAIKRISFAFPEQRINQSPTSSLYVLAADSPRSVLADLVSSPGNAKNVTGPWDLDAVHG